MDLSSVISMAKQNQKNALNQKKFGYSTTPQAPKKLEKSVNPAAVKAFLNRKKEIEKLKEEESIKKKRELEKLRVDKKHTKKARAMATRTKDNLQVYRGEDYLGRNKNKNNKEVILSPEQEMQHKAFMKRVTSERVASSENEDSDERNGIQKSYKMSRKKEKHQQKAREAAKLNFGDLLNLAQEQAKKPADDSSSDEDCSSDASSEEAASPEERYEREKRKRKQLEAQLKAMKSFKRKPEADHSNEPPVKIAKLDKGLSEDAKKAHVKALLAKFKNKSVKPESSDRSFERSKEAGRSKHSAQEVKKQRTSSNKVLVDTRKDPKLSSSVKAKEHNFMVNGKNPSIARKQDIKISSKCDSALDRRKVLPEHKNGSYNSTQSVKVKGTKSLSSVKQIQQKSIKKPPNPYAELMEKAKLNNSKPSAPCTLSVKSTIVRTNYPGVSQTDPKKPIYAKPNAPTKAMLAEYRRRANLDRSGHPGSRRTQVLQDEYSDDEEYDSDMDGFIDDDDDGLNSNSISAQIGAIFKYDKSKYGRESEYELSKMDASFKDIEREEKRSLRIAQQEDALEAKRLEEEEARKRKKR